MSETETIEVQHETERSKVEGWRLHVLIQAGYPLPPAEKLAGSEPLASRSRARVTGM